MMIFVLRKSKAGYWAVIVGGNREVLWQTEVFERKASASAACERLIEAGLTLSVVDDTGKKK